MRDCSGKMRFYCHLLVGKWWYQIQFCKSWNLHLCGYTPHWSERARERVHFFEELHLFIHSIEIESFFFLLYISLYFGCNTSSICSTLAFEYGFVWAKFQKMIYHVYASGFSTSFFLRQFSIGFKSFVICVVFFFWCCRRCCWLEL